ncbi:hypothetical protein [Neptuniibacter pectenicola]|uniref:hypothetical protein n=1 Tax=Neptuniibacter pectenicola TaxID=1806669 RepID=UPI00082F38EB|nr:hypothetical protein [Neptuniibacter pectenicola]
MNTKEIVRENGKIKAKLTKDDYDTQLLTMRNGFQWTGQPMTPELAKLTIEVLQQYLDEGL